MRWVELNGLAADPPLEGNIMLVKSQKSRTISPPLGRDSDDFVSVARRLGADESKERFEAKLKKIVKPTRKPK
jgi:hypothetical protein